MTLLNIMLFWGPTLEEHRSLQCVDHTAQLGTIHILAEDALNPIVHVTKKDVK